MNFVVVNAAECVRCGHVIQSRYVHDFKTHSCDESIWFMVDGGRGYIRRGWKGNGTRPEDHYIERSVEFSSHAYRGCLIGLA